LAGGPSRGRTACAFAASHCSRAVSFSTPSASPLSTRSWPRSGRPLAVGTRACSAPPRLIVCMSMLHHPRLRYSWYVTVMTTFPRACPASRYRIASAVSLSGYHLSITGTTLPASNNAFRKVKSFWFGLAATAFNEHSFLMTFQNWSSGSGGNRHLHYSYSPPYPKVEALCLPSDLDLRSVECGGLCHRR